MIKYNLSKMDVGNVLEMWEDVETEVESENSEESEEDIVAQEFDGDSSEEDINTPPTRTAGRSRSARSRTVEYNWQEINEKGGEKDGEKEEGSMGKEMRVREI